MTMWPKATTAGLALFLLCGCSSGPRTYAQGSSEYLDDYNCRQAMKSPKPDYGSYQECREHEIYVGEMLARAAPPPSAPVNVIINQR